MSCCYPLLPFVQLGSARKAGNNAKEQKNALDAAQSQSESTSLASCRHSPLPDPPCRRVNGGGKTYRVTNHGGMCGRLGGRADAANRAMWRQQQRRRRRRRQTANKFRVEMRVACSVRNIAEHEHESLHVPIPMPEMPQLMLSSVWL